MSLLPRWTGSNRSSNWCLLYLSPSNSAPGNRLFLMKEKHPESDPLKSQSNWRGFFSKTELQNFTLKIQVPSAKVISLHVRNKYWTTTTTKNQIIPKFRYCLQCSLDRRLYYKIKTEINCLQRITEK